MQKRTFQIYRYDPEKDAKPYMQTIEIELDGNERRSIASKLKKQHGADVTTDFRVTPDLIGGLRITLGSTVWDGTLKSRLDNFRNALAA